MEKHSQIFMKIIKNWFYSDLSNPHHLTEYLDIEISVKNNLKELYTN